MIAIVYNSSGELSVGTIARLFRSTIPAIIAEIATQWDGPVVRQILEDAKLLEMPSLVVIVCDANASSCAVCSLSHCFIHFVSPQGHTTCTHLPVQHSEVEWRWPAFFACGGSSYGSVLIALDFILFHVFVFPGKLTGTSSSRGRRTAICSSAAAVNDAKPLQVAGIISWVVFFSVGTKISSNHLRIYMLAYYFRLRANANATRLLLFSGRRPPWHICIFFHNNVAVLLRSNFPL